MGMKKVEIKEEILLEIIDSINNKIKKVPEYAEELGVTPKAIQRRIKK